MTVARSVGIVGLGLIGGSIARDLLGRGVRVLGYDRDPEARRSAAGEGIQAVESIEAVGAVELVVIAVPVSAGPSVLAALVPHVGRARLVMDVGSTKRAIVGAAEALGVGERFVGCHPLAGDHRAGWTAARAGLFAGAPVHLCPTVTTSPEALDLARELWISLGGRPEVTDAAEHDRRLAWSSHLPQIVSTTLALALRGAGVERGELGPGGRDVTRLAGSSPEMWTGVAVENADALGKAIAAMEARLAELRGMLERGDAAAIHDCFAAGRDWFATGEPS